MRPIVYAVANATCSNCVAWFNSTLPDIRLAVCRYAREMKGVLSQYQLLDADFFCCHRGQNIHSFCSAVDMNVGSDRVQY